MSRKVIHPKGYTQLKRYDLLYNSNWKPPIDFTSPPRRPNSKSILPVKLEEICKSSEKMQSPNRTEHISKIANAGCKECLVFIRMQSSLSQELAEKENRLSKCLRLIDDLIQDSDNVKAKLKIVEQENARLSDKVKVSEKSKSERQLKDLVNSRTHHVKKSSDGSRDTNHKSEEKLTESKLTDTLKENNRLKGKIEELELDKRILTNLKDEAVKSQQFMEKLYNGFKSKFAEKKEKPLEEQPFTKSMQRDLKQLRSKCSQLQSSVKESLKRHQTQSQSPPPKFNEASPESSAQKEELREKLSQMKILYETSEKSRQDIIKLHVEEINKHRQSQSLNSQIKDMVEQMEKWRRLSQDKDESILELQRQMTNKLDQIGRLKESLEKAQVSKSRIKDLEKQLANISGELILARNETSWNKEQLELTQQQAKATYDAQQLESENLQTEITRLNFEIEELHFRNRQLTTNEAILQQQLKLSQVMLKDKEHILSESHYSDKQREEQIHSAVSVVNHKHEVSLKEIQQLSIQVSGLRQTVERLEKQLEGERQKYIQAIDEWQIKFRQMEDSLQLSIENIGQLKGRIHTMNCRNIELTELLQRQRQKVLQTVEQTSKNQELIQELIEKQMRISQLEESNNRYAGKEMMSSNISGEEDLRTGINKLHLQNDWLIQSLYEKDLTISQMQKRLQSSTHKGVIDTMQTVQSDGEYQQ